MAPVVSKVSRVNRHRSGGDLHKTSDKTIVKRSKAKTHLQSRVKFNLNIADECLAQAKMRRAKSVIEIPKHLELETWKKIHRDRSKRVRLVTKKPIRYMDGRTRRAIDRKLGKKYSDANRQLLKMIKQLGMRACAIKLKKEDEECLE